MPKQANTDSDVSKGAVEEELAALPRPANPDLHGQLGHRDQDELIKDADSDFPEPGSSPEHSGESR